MVHAIQSLDGESGHYLDAAVAFVNGFESSGRTGRYVRRRYRVSEVTAILSTRAGRITGLLWLERIRYHGLREYFDGLGLSGVARMREVMAHFRHEDIALLSQIMVAEDFRRSGVATALLESACCGVSCLDDFGLSGIVTVTPEESPYFNFVTGRMGMATIGAESGFIVAGDTRPNIRTKFAELRRRESRGGLARDAATAQPPAIP